MSDSHILLLAQLSKPIGSWQELLKSLSVALVGRFDGEGTPVKSVLLSSPTSGLVWVRGISIAEALAAKDAELENSISVHFEFPRAQPSNLVEICPKKKQQPLDFSKFDEVFDGIKLALNDGVRILKGNHRIVVKFADAELATRACALFCDAFSHFPETQTYIVRTVLIKEHVILRGFYVGSCSFRETESVHSDRKGQTITEYVHSKLNHYKDRPVLLSVQCPESIQGSDVKCVQYSEDAYVVCCTNYDYRLLRNTPPVNLPGDATLLFRISAESGVTAGAPTTAPTTTAAATTTASTSSATSSNTAAVVAAAAAGIAKTKKTNTATTSATSTPGSVHILWDYDSCPITDDVTTAMDSEVEFNLVSTVSKNIQGVVDRYLQSKNDSGDSIQVTSHHRSLFSPQRPLLSSPVKANNINGKDDSVSSTTAVTGGGAASSNKTTSSHWTSFTRNEFKVHHYSRKYGVGVCMRSHVEAILKRKDNCRLILCFITNSNDFSSIAALLRLENINDILLIHNSNISSALDSSSSSLVKRRYSWTVVRSVKPAAAIAVAAAATTTTTSTTTKSDTTTNDPTTTTATVAATNSTLTTTSYTSTSLHICPPPGLKPNFNNVIISTNATSAVPTGISAITTSTSGRLLLLPPSDDLLTTTASAPPSPPVRPLTISGPPSIPFSSPSTIVDIDELAAALPPPAVTLSSPTMKELIRWMPSEASGDEFGIEEDPSLSDNKEQKSNDTTTIALTNNAKKAQNSSSTMIPASSSAAGTQKETSSSSSVWARGGAIVAATTTDDHDNEGGATTVTDDEVVLKIDLKFSSVATFFKRLVQWRKAALVSSGSSDEVEARLQHRCSYLLGEDTSDYHDRDKTVDGNKINNKNLTNLRFEVSTKVKHFYLFVRGQSTDMVSLRGTQLKKMTEEVIKVRQMHNFHGWAAEHRAALIGSELLYQQEQLAQACVLFHYTGNTTVAEIVAMHPTQATNLHRLVQKLKPKEKTIQVPSASIAWYDQAVWEKLRTRLACKAEILPHKENASAPTTSKSTSNTSLKVWGFAPKLLDCALEYIHLNDPKKEIIALSAEVLAQEITAAATLSDSRSKASVSTTSNSNISSTSTILGGNNDGDKNTAVSVKDAKKSTTGTASTTTEKTKDDKKSTSPNNSNCGLDQMVLDNKSENKKTNSNNSTSSPNKKQFQWTHHFADKDAGAFFCHFENQFRHYLEQTFAVTVDITREGGKGSDCDNNSQTDECNDVNLTFNNKTISKEASRSSDSDDAVTTVVLHGPTQKNVSAARAYLEQFSSPAAASKSLLRVELFFPRVNAKKYRDICTKKTTETNRMVSVRLMEMADICPANPSAAIIDPLLSRGFLSIRIKPPYTQSLMMNSNNNSKITFPIDVTVTVCGSALSDEGCAVMDQTEEAFDSIASDYAVGVVTIPSTHPMKQKLTLKSERDEFMRSFSLVAIRLESNRRRNKNSSSTDSINVRIWAFHQRALDVVLNELRNADTDGTTTTTVLKAGSKVIDPIPPTYNNSNNMYNTNMYNNTNIVQGNNSMGNNNNSINTSTSIAAAEGNFSNSSSNKGFHTEYLATTHLHEKNTKLIIQPPPPDNNIRNHHTSSTNNPIQAPSFASFNTSIKTSTSSHHQQQQQQQYPFEQQGMSHSQAGGNLLQFSSLVKIPERSSDNNDRTATNTSIAADEVETCFSNLTTTVTSIDQQSDIEQMNLNRRSPSTLSTNSAVASATGGGGAGSISLLSNSSPPSSSLSASDENAFHDHHKQEISIHDSLPTLDASAALWHPVTDHTAAVDRSEERKPNELHQQNHSSLQHRQSQTVIYLPDLSLRYMLQGEPLKRKLKELIHRFSLDGVHMKYPYIDNRNDPHACFQLEGNNDVVLKAAALAMNEFVDKAARSVRCVQVVVNNDQYNALISSGSSQETSITGSVLNNTTTSDTSAPIQELQQQAGVHLIFGPPSASLREAHSLFDLRLSSELVNNRDAEFISGSTEQQRKLPSDPDMMSVKVFNCYSKRSVEINVISSNSSDIGWTWGVNCLLLLVGSNLIGYTPFEIAQLNRGDVLVNSDPQTGKTILRMKPNSLTRGINLQAGVLTNALLKCLQKGNEMGIQGIAVSAPTDIEAFPELSPELIRSLTIEAITEFAKKCRSFLRFTKIVCIELGNNIATINKSVDLQSPVAVAAALEKTIEPCQRDRMVRTILLLLERQEAEALDDMLLSSYDPNNNSAAFNTSRGGGASAQAAFATVTKSKMSLLTCNVPLPLSFYPTLAAHDRQKGVHTLLVRGLLSGIVKALDLIKSKLVKATPSHTMPMPSIHTPPSVSLHHYHHHHHHSTQQDTSLLPSRIPPPPANNNTNPPNFNNYNNSYSSYSTIPLQHHSTINNNYNKTNPSNYNTNNSSSSRNNNTNLSNINTNPSNFINNNNNNINNNFNATTTRNTNAGHMITASHNNNISNNHNSFSVNSNNYNNAMNYHNNKTNYPIPFSNPTSASSSASYAGTPISSVSAVGASTAAPSSSSFTAAAIATNASARFAAPTGPSAAVNASTTLPTTTTATSGWPLSNMGPFEY